MLFNIIEDLDNLTDQMTPTNRHDEHVTCKRHIVSDDMGIAGDMSRVLCTKNMINIYQYLL